VNVGDTSPVGLPQSLDLTEDACGIDDDDRALRQTARSDRHVVGEPATAALAIERFAQRLQRGAITWLALGQARDQQLVGADAPRAEALLELLGQRRLTGGNSAREDHD